MWAGYDHFFPRCMIWKDKTLHEYRCSTNKLATNDQDIVLPIKLDKSSLSTKYYIKSNFNVNESINIIHFFKKL